MQYTARGGGVKKSIIIARGKAECYIGLETPL